MKGKVARGHGRVNRQPAAVPKANRAGEGGAPPERPEYSGAVKVPSLSQLLRSKLLLAGLLFFGLNCTYSYMFYQVNSFKIALVLAGVSVIAVWNDLLFPENTENGVPWKQLLILSVPLLATLPGYLWHGGNYNYYFRYELSSYLVVIVWALYLYRGVRKEEELKPFFFFICVTVFYVSCWALLEKIGYDPMSWRGIPALRVKSTFGNSNYFAGFLVIIIPLLLSFCLPEKMPGHGALEKPRSLAGQINLFYVAVLILAGVSLVLTETRAAQAAALFALLVFALFYGLTFANPKTKKKLCRLAFAGTLLAVAAVILLFAFSSHLPQSRYSQLFTFRGWGSRFAGWIPALKSIEASPLIGYGLGSSYNLFFAFIDPAARLYSPEHSYNHVHSEFLEYTQEGGLIGLAILLLFWGYLFYQIFKVLKSEQAGFSSKKLAIGIIAGFAGYLLQSAFSVAPRMMVVKFPLFTLIGLTLILTKLLPEAHASSATPGRGRGKLVSIAPALVGLGLTWVIFTPWLIGQYRFMKLRVEIPTPPVIEELEKLVKSYPDIYALNYLAFLEVNSRHVEGLQRTLAQIDKVLPDYEEEGYTKALLAMMQGNLPQARQLALEHQQKHDRYFADTINLLMKMALSENDFDLFRKQFALLVRWLVFHSNLYDGIDGSDVVVGFGETKQPLKVEAAGTKFVIDWNVQTVRELFAAGQTVRQENGYAAQDRSAFLTSLGGRFSRQPYFQLNIKKGYSRSELAAIKDKIAAYFEDESKLRVISRESRAEQQRESALEEKVEVERTMAARATRAQMQEYGQYLSARSDWSLFLRKRKFLNDFLGDIGRVIYPPELAGKK